MRPPYSPGPITPTPYATATVERIAAVERTMRGARARHGYVPKRGKWTTTRFAPDKLAKLDLQRERALRPDETTSTDLDALVADMVANPGKYLRGQS